MVRANQPLVDRMDTSVGPFRIEVLEPLQSLRVVCDAPDLELSCDLRWEGVFEAWIEPRHYSRKHGRVVFDTSRFAQNGRWTGWLRVGDETPDRWWGARDRSWGVRPVGEPERLGSAQPDHTLEPGTRMIRKPSTFHLPDAPGGPLAITCTPMVHNYLDIGTGYGLGNECRQGMWIGNDVTVEGKSWTMEELETWAWWAIVEHCARFEYDDPALGSQTGHAMFEHMFIGAYPPVGLPEATSVAT